MTVLDRIPAPAPGNAYFSALQKEVDGCVGSFAAQAVEFKSLAALSAGSMAYRAGRLGAMGLGNGSALRAASVGLGLSAEVSTFEFINRSFAEKNSNLWRWSGSSGIRQGLLQALLTFGTLKGAGRLTQGENLIVQHLFQDSAMVLGHQVAGVLGVAPCPTGSMAEQFLLAEATNLQIGAGMALAHGFAPGLHALERGLDLAFTPNKDSAFPPAFKMFPESREWAPASFPVREREAAEPLFSASRPFLMVDSSGRGGRGKKLSSFSVRQLIHEVRENNNPKAARELAKRATREPRLFFQSYELKWILGALAKPRSLRVEENLIHAVENLLDKAWGIFDEAHLQEMLHLVKERPLLAPELSPLIKKLKDLRPDIAFAGALRDMAPDFPLSEVGRSSLNAQFEPTSVEDSLTFRSKKVRITAETIEFDGQVEFHEDTDPVMRTLPRRFHGDLFESDSEPQPPRLRFDTPEWNLKIASALRDLRLAQKGASKAFDRLLNRYVDEAGSEFSAYGPSKYKRLDQLAGSQEPEIQEALKRISVDWMVEAAKSEPILRFFLQNLARLGHPGALSGLVDLANRGYEFVRPLLRELEMRRILEEVAAGDILAQADLVDFLSLKDLTEEEADRAAAGLLRAAEAGFARKDDVLTEFAFAKLYDLSLSPHRKKVFQRIHPYEGTLFRTLREKVETFSLGIAASAFLFEAACMSSFDALEILIAVAPKNRKIQDRLREILREIPKEDLPEVIELTDTRLSFGEEMAIHVRLRKQKMRKRIVQVLAQILKGDET